RLLLQFRKWLRPGWNKRFGDKFGKEYYNEIRQENDKGIYVSLWDFIAAPAKGKINSTLFKEFDYFKNTMSAIARDYKSLITRGQLHWFNLSEQERSNIKASIMELLYMAGFIVALQV